MRTEIPEKLLKIADAIYEKGSQNLTRLTVLKKWFEKRSRLLGFAFFIAKKSSHKKGKSKGVVGELFDRSRIFLKEINEFQPKFNKIEAEQLYQDLKAFQSETKSTQWAAVRIIKNLNLFLIEQALEIILFKGNSSDGYSLARNFCENYDPKYGNSLNGKSINRIDEIAQFILVIEAKEKFAQDSGINSVSRCSTP